MFGLENFVLTPFEMETEDGDAPLIDGGWVDFTKAIGVGNHFATAGEADVGAVHFANLFL